MGVIYKNGVSYGGGGGSGDYEDITNKPQINGNTLEGNLTAADLGLADDNTLSVNEDGELAVVVIDNNAIQSLFNI